MTNTTESNNTPGARQQYRHPEKRLNKESVYLKKPSWIRGKVGRGEEYRKSAEIVKRNGLHTVCQEAGCPNIGECWEKRHVTFMIMGAICTRACAFCNVATGKPGALDETEPYNVARAVADLGLKHVVITSVDRDDLSDGGASHFAKTIQTIKHTSPQTTIEVLTPDFQGNLKALEKVIGSGPDVFNHNLETVPRLYPHIRFGARYFRSLRVLSLAKDIDSNIFTKSGLMVGLGEEEGEVYQVMDDMRAADIDFLTIGQYLQPTRKHAPVHRYVVPEEFTKMRKMGYGKGFLLVSSSPLTRSSYHADSDFARLQAVRRKDNKQDGLTNSMSVVQTRDSNT